MSYYADFRCNRTIDMVPGYPEPRRLGNIMRALTLEMQKRSIPVTVIDHIEEKLTDKRIGVNQGALIGVIRVMEEHLSVGSHPGCNEIRLGRS
jgi:hypothetical protein